MASPFFSFIAYTFVILGTYNHQTIDYISNIFNGSKMAYFSKTKRYNSIFLFKV